MKSSTVRGPSLLVSQKSRGKYADIHENSLITFYKASCFPNRKPRRVTLLCFQLCCIHEYFLSQCHSFTLSRFDLWCLKVRNRCRNRSISTNSVRVPARRSTFSAPKAQLSSTHTQQDHHHDEAHEALVNHHIPLFGLLCSHRAQDFTLHQRKTLVRQLPQTDWKSPLHSHCHIRNHRQSCAITMPV